MPPEEGWVHMEEVAAHLGVAKESICRLVESTGFSTHCAGRLLRFKLPKVDEWILSGNYDGVRGRRIVRTKARVRND